MKTLIRASIFYFPLVFVYKALAPDPEYINGIMVNYLVRCYWVNYFWFVTSIWLMLVFVGVFNIVSMFSGIYEERTIKMYKVISIIVACYWAAMAAIRLYLFFNIEQHYNLIDKAGLLGFGTVSIFVLLTFLTFKSWFKR